MATEIADGVWWFDFRGVNAYLFDVRDDGDGAEDEDPYGVTLIDAGAPWTRRDLRKELQAVGIAPRDVSRIALTHNDSDHIGGLSGLEFDATIYAGEPDADVLRGAQTPGWGTRKAALQTVTATVSPTVPDAVETVTDGDSVGNLTVYETPGHTAGHLAYVSESQSVAFLGDLVRESGGRLEASPWVLSDDTAEVATSIRRLVNLDLDMDVLAMGHGTPFVERGTERLADLAARL